MEWRLLRKPREQRPRRRWQRWLHGSWARPHHWRALEVSNTCVHLWGWYLKMAFDLRTKHQPQRLIIVSSANQRVRPISSIDSALRTPKRKNQIVIHRLGESRIHVLQLRKRQRRWSGEWTSRKRKGFTVRHPNRLAAKPKFPEMPASPTRVIIA